MKALIFDMDGVLVDVSNSYMLAIKKTVEFFLKTTVTFNEIQNYKDRGYNNDWDLTYAIIKARGYNIKKSDVINKFQEFYLGKNFDGLIRNERWLLKKNILKDLTNYKLAIITSRPKKEAVFTIERFKVKEYFKILITMEGVKKKPNPNAIRYVMKKLNVNEAYYFGDNVVDMKMAKEAGIIGVGVLPSGRNDKLKRLLILNGAKFILNDINKIKEVIK